VIVYGRNAVRELLRAGRRPVQRVWATRRAAPDGVEVIEASGEEIERVCGSPDHQGICAETTAYAYVGADELLAAEDPLIVMLDEIQDPQNMGAICRTAECVGATGVVIPERRSAEVTPAVCKASAGAVEWLPIARVRNLADFLGEARDAGCWSYGAAADGAMAYDEPDYRGGVVLALGAEGKGLRPRVAQSCDALVALPMRGQIGSLNVSVAAAALLYEILQRRP
jgi:23S rRNA (guanosine2251-2'-O)-methyltransferase